MISSAKILALLYAKHLTETWCKDRYILFVKIEIDMVAALLCIFTTVLNIQFYFSLPP